MSSENIQVLLADFCVVADDIWRLFRPIILNWIKYADWYIKTIQRKCRYVQLFIGEALHLHITHQDAIQKPANHQRPCKKYYLIWEASKKL
jgi:hypothetical protein